MGESLQGDLRGSLRRQRRRTDLGRRALAADPHGHGDRRGQGGSSRGEGCSEGGGASSASHGDSEAAGCEGGTVQARTLPRIRQPAVEASLEGCGRQHDRPPHRGRAKCKEAADRDGGLAVQSRGPSLFAGRSAGGLEGGDHEGDRERTRSPSSQAGKSPASSHRRSSATGRSRSSGAQGRARTTSGRSRQVQGPEQEGWWQEEQAVRACELIRKSEGDRSN